MRWMLVLLAVGCGGARECDDPCPGAVSVSAAQIRTQTGLQDCVECTASCGWVMRYPAGITPEQRCDYEDFWPHTCDAYGKP